MFISYCNREILERKWSVFASFSSKIPRISAQSLGIYKLLDNSGLFWWVCQLDQRRLFAEYSTLKNKVFGRPVSTNFLHDVPVQLCHSRWIPDCDKTWWTVESRVRTLTAKSNRYSLKQIFIRTSSYSFAFRNDTLFLQLLKNQSHHCLDGEYCLIDL